MGSNVIYSQQKNFTFAHNKMENMFKVAMNYIIIGENIVHEVIFKIIEKYLQNIYILDGNIIRIYYIVMDICIFKILLYDF